MVNSACSARSRWRPTERRGRWQGLQETGRGTA
jgi:hypothetical protein